MRRFLVLTAAVAVMTFGASPAWAQYAGDEGSASVDDTTPTPGQVLGFTIERGSCEAGSTGDIDLNPEQRDLGDFTSDQEGGASGQVQIPTDIQPGDKTIAFSCPDDEGVGTEVLSVSITVVAADLADTGAGSWGDTLLNAALIALVGVVLVWIASQRRKVRAARAGDNEHAGV